MDENTLNDLLECSVCLDRLDTSSKVLPCQHTFCRKCLEVIIASRQELRCPECRILVEVKIDELPPNVLLMRILEGIKNATKLPPQQHHSNDIRKEQNMSKGAEIKGDRQQLQQLQEQKQQQVQQQLKCSKQAQQQPNLQRINNTENNLTISASTVNTNQQLTQNQTLQQHQIPPTLQNVTNLQQQTLQATAQSNISATSSSSSQQHHNQQQQKQAAQQTSRRCHVPHAYALYDFKSNEPTDLNFKKGDFILLKRKIDNNWCIGQMYGVEGTFPISYVQVVVPLPAPQCIALYDFKMGPNEEEGCLTFKKGTIIHVLRRVDQNWAEGRIGTNIGIFPIAFVELNELAKQLLDNYLSANNQQQQQQIAAASQQSATGTTITSIPTAMSTMGTSTSAQKKSAKSNDVGNQSLQQQSQQQQQSRNLPKMPLIDPTTNTNADSTSSSSSSSNNSPNSTNTCSTNSTSNSMVSSPKQTATAQNMSDANATNVATTTVCYRDIREKRHSLNALLNGGAAVGLGALSILQTNRHSAEILSMPSDLGASLTASATTTTTGNDATATQHMRQRSMHEISSTTSQVNNINCKQQQLQKPNLQQQSTSATLATPTPRINIIKPNAPALPWSYLALYPYKPRKNDELELKKGCVYIVTERCLDGWFKGKNWQDTAGVFPGNYVTPLRNRDHQQLMHNWKTVPAQPVTKEKSTEQQSTTQRISPQTIAHQKQQNLDACQLTPPYLPPRRIGDSQSVNVCSVWTKPLSQTVEAFFNRASCAGGGSNKIEQTNEKHKETNATTITNPTASATKSAAVSLMKRLTHIKTRSKSPSNAQTAAIQQQQTLDNPTFEEINTSISNYANNTQHPVHVRSGSCPSQLLQSLPIDLNATHLNESVPSPPPPSQQQQQHQQISPQPIITNVSYGSQRIKGSKERSQLQHARQSFDANCMRGIYNNIVAQQQQQQQLQPISCSPVLTKCGQQQQQQAPPQQFYQTNINTHIIGNHRKSQSLDANSLMAAPIVPGGGVAVVGSTTVATTVPSCHITAAAIAASATTKSAHCIRESRFRCIVPYPPNSDIELELQVGDIIYVQRKQKNGWYKGTHARTNKTGLFPASFVEPDI